MGRYTGHCRGCNQTFVATDSDCCPQCGEELTVASDQPTVNWGVTLAVPVGDAVPSAMRAGSGDLARQLVGTQLSFYHIEQFLGRGGMAWVFLAQHDMLHRPCAVKVLSPELVRRQPRAVDACSCPKPAPPPRWCTRTS